MLSLIHKHERMALTVSFGILTVTAIALFFGVHIGKVATGQISSSTLITHQSENFVSLDAGDQFGYDVALIGDVDDDGVNDLVVGAKSDDDDDGDADTGLNKGAVYILFMNGDGTIKSTSKISDTSGGFTNVLLAQDKFGGGVEGIGDFNNDGVPDIAVGANGDDARGNAAGTAYLIYLTSEGAVSDFDEILPTGIDATDAFGDGGIANLGDLDGDGVIDLAVGAYYGGSAGMGAVHILFLNADGTIKSQAVIDDATEGFVGILSEGGGTDLFGVSVDAVPDIDGDGNSELLAGSYYDDDGVGNGGAAYLIYLNDAGGIKSYVKYSALNPTLTPLIAQNDDFGSGSTYLGDLDDDGNIEIAIGADGYDVGGAVHILSINASGEIQNLVTLASGINGMSEISAVNYFGWGLDGVGDINGDGVPDLAAGTYGHDPSGLSNAGGLYLLTLQGGVAGSDTGGGSSTILIPNNIQFSIPPQTDCSEHEDIVFEVSGGNIKYVYLAQYSWMRRSTTHAYQPGNGASFGDRLINPSPTSYYVARSIDSTLEPVMYLAVRSSSGALSSIYSVSLENFSTVACPPVDSGTNTNTSAPSSPSNTDSTSTVPEVTEGETQEGSTPQEPVLTPVYPGDIITGASRTTTTFYVTDDLKKRPFTSDAILATWLSPVGSLSQSSEEIKVVTDATLPALPTGPAMLPKGPAIIKYRTDGPTHYITADQVVREIASSVSEVDLFRSTTWQDHLQYVPFYLEWENPEGRPIVRYENAVVSEWMRFIKTGNRQR